MQNYIGLYIYSRIVRFYIRGFYRDFSLHLHVCYLFRNESWWVVRHYSQVSVADRSSSGFCFARSQILRVILDVLVCTVKIFRSVLNCKLYGLFCFGIML